MIEVKRYKLFASLRPETVSFLPDEVVRASDYDALRAENERLAREAKNDAIAYRAVIERQEELRSELAALKAVPDGMEVAAYLNTTTGRVVTYGPTLMDCDDEREPVETLMTIAQHNAIVAALRQPVADEREAFEGWATHICTDRQPLRKEWYLPATQTAWEAWQARAALSAPAAGHQPIRMPTDELESVLSEAEGVRDLSDIAHGWYEATECIERLNAAPIQQSFPAAAWRDVSALVESHRKHAARLIASRIPLVEALGQTRIDLAILRGSFAQAAKYDHKAEGMDDEIGKWIGRIDAALAAHKAGGV